MKNKNFNRNKKYKVKNIVRMKSFRIREVRSFKKRWIIIIKINKK